MQQIGTAVRKATGIRRRALITGSLIVIVVAAIFGMARGVSAAPREMIPPPMRPSVSLSEMQAMIFVWASGTPAIQQLARQQCASMHLLPAQCAQVSQAVRAAWLALLRRDPAALGRPTARPNFAARQRILQDLFARLAGIEGLHVPVFLTATGSAYQVIRDPRWARGTRVKFGRPIPLGRAALVWATAYEQTALPPGMTPTGSQYAALPDVYLSMANVGNGANIPSFYQPYYLPAGGAHWAVSVATASAGTLATNVLITDVGPWNEDDNWWDANDPSATLSASCPVSTALVAPDATSNALVDGICPNGHNYRRLYYYLLYQHNGLPFFQATNYAPSGTFTDGTAWPPAMPYRCAETAAASINNDTITCAGGALANYNGHHGAWLRDGTNDNPILNQSSIDLSPAVDAALGWTYPSSGLVWVNTAMLP
jgi:hypothetical protein